MPIPNQSINSSEPGHLRGSVPGALPGQVAAGQDLESFLQQIVAGVAGLDGTLVRPRWQPEPPNLPEQHVDWAAIGVGERRPLGSYAVVVHKGEDDGHDDLRRHEEFDLLVSFYGPHASDQASNLNDGMLIAQNRETLFLYGLAYVGASATTRMPELIQSRWLDRSDVTLTFRRIIRRTYPVLNVLSATGAVDVETYDVAFDTTNLEES